jgi:hypothetical protein
VLREDVQPRSRLRAQHLQRGRQADDLPRERVPGRRRQGELLRGALHAERARGVPHGRPRPVPRRDGRRDRGLPADPQPEREPHPAVAKLDQERAAAYFMLGETTGTSAGGASEAGKFLRVPRHEPILPPSARAAGQPDPRAARDAPDRDLPAEHGAASGAATTTNARRRSRSRTPRRA